MVSINSLFSSASVTPSISASCERSFSAANEAPAAAASARSGAGSGAAERTGASFVSSAAGSVPSAGFSSVTVFFLKNNIFTSCPDPGVPPGRPLVNRVFSMILP